MVVMVMENLKQGLNVMEQSLTAALVGGTTAFIGKVIWDWFQSKRSKEGEHCNDHDCIAKEITQLRLDWMTQNAKHEQVLAVIQTDLSYIKRKLDMNGASK